MKNLVKAFGGLLVLSVMLAVGLYVVHHEDLSNATRIAQGEKIKLALRGSQRGTLVEVFYVGRWGPCIPLAADPEFPGGGYFNLTTQNPDGSVAKNAYDPLDGTDARKCWSKDQ